MVTTVWWQPFCNKWKAAYMCWWPFNMNTLIPWHSHQSHFLKTNNYVNTHIKRRKINEELAISMTNNAQHNQNRTTLLKISTFNIHVHTTRTANSQTTPNCRTYRTSLQSFPLHNQQLQKVGLLHATFTLIFYSKFSMNLDEIHAAMTSCYCFVCVHI